jgi:hypothetical protein
MAVQNRTEVLDDIYTSTLNNRVKEVQDQIFVDTPLLRWMKAKGGIKLDGTGGRYIEVPLSYAKNETVKSIAKGDTVSLSDTAFLTVAQFTWKYLAGSIVRYMVDDAQNKSKEAILNLANAKIDNLKMSLSDEIETMLFADGTGNDSKDIEGLKNIVSASPTSALTVGNIPQSTNAYWQNKQKTASGSASATLLTDMRTLFNNCSNGQGVMAPTIAVTDQASYELYEDEVTEQKQIVDKTLGDAEFRNIEFKGIPLIWSSKCTSGYMYFLNEKVMKLVIDPDMYFAPTPWKDIPNQVNDRVMQILCKMNLITSRRKSLGVLTGIAA